MAAEHDSSPAEAPARVAAIAPGRPGNSVVSAARAAPSPPSHRHRQPVARLVAQSFPYRDTPARRAYRDYLTTLPAPAVYPEREPNPAGAAILTDLAHPGIRQQRQQRLQDNLNTLRAYQHQRTPPPVTTRTAPPTPPTRSTTPPTINRNQDRGRGYGR